MTDFGDIQHALQDTAGAAARLRVAVATDPSDRVARFNLAAVEKRQVVLAERLKQAAGADGREVCSYRLISDACRQPLGPLAAALGEFQSLLSVTCESLKRGPRRTSRVGRETADETAMDFAYAFAGSAGFVFTVPVAGGGLFAPLMDEAAGVIFQLAGANDAAALAASARRYGVGVIRALYRWADAHSHGGYAADIDWTGAATQARRRLIQAAEFRRLRDVIAATGEQEVADAEAAGRLVGIDVDARSFHFELDVGGHVRGHLGPDFARDRAYVLPHRYLAQIRRTTHILYSTDEEKVQNTLLALSPSQPSNLVAG